MTYAAFRETLACDFDRNALRLDRLTVFVFRLGQFAHTRALPLRLVWKLLDLVYMQLLIGAELPPTVRAGPGLALRHAGRGVTLHPWVELGADVVLYHQVTIGSTGAGRATPRLGDRCFVGVGAAVLGPIVLGDDVRVGAGAVVLQGAPSGVTLVGVPATQHQTDTPPGAFVFSRRAGRRAPASET